MPRPNGPSRAKSCELPDHIRKQPSRSSSSRKNPPPYHLDPNSQASADLTEDSGFLSGASSFTDDFHPSFPSDRAASKRRGSKRRDLTRSFASSAENTFAGISVADISVDDTLMTDIYPNESVFIGEDGQRLLPMRSVPSPLTPASKTSFENDVPRPPRPIISDDSETSTAISESELLMTDEQKAWAGIAAVLRDSDSLGASDVLPADILKALADSYSTMNTGKGESYHSRNTRGSNGNRRAGVGELPKVNEDETFKPGSESGSDDYRFQLPYTQQQPAKTEMPALMDASFSSLVTDLQSLVTPESSAHLRVVQDKEQASVLDQFMGAVAVIASNIDREERNERDQNAEMLNMFSWKVRQAKENADRLAEKSDMKKQSTLEVGSEESGADIGTKDADPSTPRKSQKQNSGDQDVRGQSASPAKQRIPTPAVAALASPGGKSKKGKKPDLKSPRPRRSSTGSKPARPRQADSKGSQKGDRRSKSRSRSRSQEKKVDKLTESQGSRGTKKSQDSKASKQNSKSASKPSKKSQPKKLRRASETSAAATTRQQQRRKSAPNVGARDETQDTRPEKNARRRSSASPRQSARTISDESQPIEMNPDTEKVGKPAHSEGSITLSPTPNDETPTESVNNESLPSLSPLGAFDFDGQVAENPFNNSMPSLATFNVADSGNTRRWASQGELKVEEDPQPKSYPSRVPQLRSPRSPRRGRRRMRKRSNSTGKLSRKDSLPELPIESKQEETLPFEHNESGLDAFHSYFEKETPVEQSPKRPTRRVSMGSFFPTILSPTTRTARSRKKAFQGRDRGGPGAFSKLKKGLNSMFTIRKKKGATSATSAHIDTGMRDAQFYPDLDDDDDSEYGNLLD